MTRRRLKLFEKEPSEVSIEQHRYSIYSIIGFSQYSGKLEIDMFLSQRNTDEIIYQIIKSKKDKNYRMNLKNLTDEMSVYKLKAFEEFINIAPMRIRFQNLLGLVSFHTGENLSRDEMEKIIRLRGVENLDIQRI